MNFLFTVILWLAIWAAVSLPLGIALGKLIAYSDRQEQRWRN